MIERTFSCKRTRINVVKYTGSLTKQLATARERVEVFEDMLQANRAYAERIQHLLCLDISHRGRIRGNFYSDLLPPGYDPFDIYEDVCFNRSRGLSNCTTVQHLNGTWHVVRLPKCSSRYSEVVSRIEAKILELGVLNSHLSDSFIDLVSLSGEDLAVALEAESFVESKG